MLGQKKKKIHMWKKNKFPKIGKYALNIVRMLNILHMAVYPYVKIKCNIVTYMIYNYKCRIFFRKLKMWPFKTLYKTFLAEFFQQICKVCVFLSSNVHVSEWIHTLNIKELLTRNRRDIWRLTDCNGTRTHNHLVRKGTINHLVKWSVLPNGWVFLYKLSGCGFEYRCKYIKVALGKNI